MNPRTVLRIWLALLCLALPSAVAQNPAPVGAAADAVQRVKHFYFALDYLGGGHSWTVRAMSATAFSGTHSGSWCP